jgi:GT2 family glycosyltransferase
MLEKLVISILSNNLNKSIIDNVFIIIVDNDPDKSAADVFISIEKRNTLRTFKFKYFNLDKPGLANVRNELFRRALENHPDFIISIDDDEYVCRDWLNQLVLTITNTQADIVTGPVIPITENKVTAYIEYLITAITHWPIEKHYNDHQRIETFKTGNYIINASVLVQKKLEFDQRFNYRGGEDTYFGLVARKKGATVFWAKYATAYETFTKERTSIMWLLRRKYRGALNFVFILKVESDHYQIIRKFFIGLAHLFVGLIGSILFMIPVKKRLYGLLKLCEGFGTMAGFFNYRLDEYT